MVHIVNPVAQCITCAQQLHVFGTCAICVWNTYPLQRGTNQSLGTNPLTSWTMQASPSGPATPASQQSRHRSHHANMHQWQPRPRCATHTRTQGHTRAAAHTNTHAHTDRYRQRHTQTERETERGMVHIVSPVAQCITCAQPLHVFGTCAICDSSMSSTT